jgi:cellulose synthase/poly-beta-1,6-N-acetylglucosamine synthase-like glycosyltransferase
MIFLSYVFMGVYCLVLSVLCAYGIHRYWILYAYWKYRRRPAAEPLLPQSFLPPVTIQLPIYNELYVLRRLVESVCALDYPRELMEIQVLDDSVDETCRLARDLVATARQKGFDIHYLHRSSRAGFKAGALACGLTQARGQFIAIFDADFTPAPDFLKKTLPYFQDSSIGMVQARWGHLNAGYSLLTRLQAVFLDGHFVLEHTARHRSGAFFNFNGTAGVWRKVAIEASGGWQSDTLTEDLDLSYRAQMADWKFIFLPHVVCPGELPVDIHSYRSQQYRWAKGSLQVARKILGTLLRRPVSWRIKLEACAHLTANMGYAFVVALAILFFPSLIVRQAVRWPVIPFLEVGAFFLTVVSIASFYGVALKEIYPDWRWRCRDIPILMAFGVGMCVNNSRAVIHALFGVPSSFERTAKFNVHHAGESWRGKLYRNRGFSYGIIELGLLAYVFATFLWAFEAHMWTSLPFIAFYLVGFSYIGYLSFNHRWGPKEVTCQTRLSSS